MVARGAKEQGFTLIEVLIALAITAFVGAAAYSGLSAVISGVESTRAVAERSWEVNRALMILSRDLRHFSPRPVRDEFGEQEPALSGGRAARFMLSFTRSGWHNSGDYNRSNLQRVNYVVQEEALWRESYPVLDRAGSTEPRRVLLLDGVRGLRLSFLDAPASLGPGSRGTMIDTRNWPENWVMDTSQPGQQLAPPVALELVLELDDLGELRSLHALPPF
ncbi:type II secretion system protein GspJ [Kineobactrum sediminis]|uniref:Type II secretion system protein J n=1 Tax=Kineobactrum sediminis TaxID=1905677 RepID=A0A2N5Y0L2_9GAMM|nr:type II secretion system minor pseudopilin GspJ [Kineobactrum sediminis]PLW81932.1 type II secretion system protein GspJ [Kineobactrum sediminis]